MRVNMFVYYLNFFNKVIELTFCLLFKFFLVTLGSERISGDLKI